MPRDIRRPRRSFSPERDRRIRIENAVFLAGTIMFWALMGALFGRMMRWW